MTNLKINHSHHNILEKRNFHFDMSTWLYLYKFVKPEGKQLNSRERKKNRNRSEHISKEWLYNQQNKEVWTTSLVSHSHSRFRSQNRDRTRDHDRNSDRRLTERERFHSISPNRCHSRSPRHNSVSRRRSLSSCVTFKIFFYVKGNRLLGNDVYSIIQVALRLKNANLNTMVILH
ncbi:uncharacterized protein LOC143257319 isoform X4 [Tachypleus tridentatus]|uniref:uncharacterized protein LOC143257319 isoform X4 n=1 Tax=Tachypleus tridentatus TaxID=6853 RepID=UPI003FCFC884